MKEPEAATAPKEKPPHVGHGSRPRSGLRGHPVLAMGGLAGVLLCAWLLVRLFAKPKAHPAAPAGRPKGTRFLAKPRLLHLVDLL